MRVPLQPPSRLNGLPPRLPTPLFLPKLHECAPSPAFLARLRFKNPGRRRAKGAREGRRRGPCHRGSLGAQRRSDSPAVGGDAGLVCFGLSIGALFKQTAPAYGVLLLGAMQSRSWGERRGCFLPGPQTGARPRLAEVASRSRTRGEGGSPRRRLRPYAHRLTRLPGLDLGSGAGARNKGR